MFVSSANRKNVSLLEILGRSFMYRRKSNDPSTEPCGTPREISKVSERLPATETCCCLPDKYDQNHCKGIPLTP